MPPHPLDHGPGGCPEAVAPCPRIRVETEADPLDEAVAERALQALFQGTLLLRERIRMAWRERDLAERVAWSAPGVTQVEDHLVVQRTASAKQHTRIH